MLLFAHLLAGTLAGVILAPRSDRYIIFMCMIGSWLPDILDKPLAIGIASMGSGRTLGHSLLFVLIIVLIGLLLLPRMMVLGLSSSVFLHQILDMMWQYQETWFFPLKGWFYVDPWIQMYVGRTFLDYYGGGITILQTIQTLLLLEIGNPIERVSIIILLLVFIYVLYTTLTQ